MSLNNFLQAKPLLASRTVWGALLAMAASLAGLAGFSVSGNDQAEAISLIDQLIGEWDRLAALAGGALALYGRIKASRRIG